MSANYYRDIGNQLRKIRLEKRKEIKDIAQDSRISEDYIAAIEAGNIKEFPSTVYYNLFARAYARELGVDPEKMFVISSEETLELEKVEELGEKISEQELRGLDVQVDDNEKSVGTTVFWVAGVLVIIIAAVLIFYFTEFGGKESNQDTNTQPREDIVVGQMEQEEASQPVDSPAIMAGENTPSNVEIIDKEPEPKPKKESPAKPKLPPMTLRIDVIDSSWVLVIADGDTVLNRSLFAGDFRTLRADRRFIFTAWNPSGLRLKLNDRDMRSISPIGRPVRNLVIDRTNMVSYYRAPDSSGNGE